MPDSDAPPINQASSFYNERLVQTTNDRGLAHCIVLPSGIDGIDMEENAPVPSMENINMLDATLVSVYEVSPI